MFLNKKKLFLAISICLTFFFLAYNDVKSQEIEIIEGKSVVIDGDTIRINDKKIRLIGIDAPEQKQKCKKSEIQKSTKHKTKKSKNLEILNQKYENMNCFSMNFIRQIFRIK